MGANNADWLANERAVFMQVAEDFHYYGLKASMETIVLHHDVSRTGTSCPKRSMQTHGGSYPEVRKYFIKQVAYYMSLGKTVKDMVNALNDKKESVMKIYKENGTFYPNETIIVRDRPNTQGNIVARYYKGEKLAYHTVYIGNGYVWLEYLRNNGKSGYIPIREYNNGKFGKIWGTVE